MVVVIGSLPASAVLTSHHLLRVFECARNVDLSAGLEIDAFGSIVIVPEIVAADRSHQRPLLPLHDRRF
jgi:hypothetical protein